MYSNSLEKALNSILNTLPRILAPSEAINILRKKRWKKKLKKKKMSNEKFLVLNIAISRKIWEQVM
jgi:hypothetical protein